MDIQPLNDKPVASAPAREAPPAPALPAVEKPPPAPTQDEVREAIKEIQRNVGNSSTSLQFSVDRATGRTIVSIIDAETKEIVRQIPTEEVMKLARTLDRMQGLLVNGKA
jgi:flagellar protein FlaG